jgi:hypothetical protein
MKHYQKLIALVLILTIGLSMAGCSTLDKTDKVTTAGDKNKTLKSTNGKLELTVPDSWKEQDLNNEEAIFEAADLSKEQYLLIISESKEDFTADTTAFDYLELVVENMKIVTTNLVAAEPQNIKISGFDAAQCEVSADVGKVKIKYLVTIIKSEDQFIQATAWSLSSKYDENKTTLESVVNSIKVVE